jgi:beta-ketoacyl-acyl-carrier-protein synthase II
MSGIVALPVFDEAAVPRPIGGTVKDFDPTGVIDTKELRRVDRSTLFALGAAQEAVRDSGLGEGGYAPEDVGVIFGSGAGGYNLVIENHRIMDERGARRVSPFLIANMLPDTASGYIAIQLGAIGPNMAVTAACSTGGTAIGEAFETVRRGDAEIIVTGGAEAPLTPVVLASFAAMRALADAPEPAQACKPFDLERNGFVVSEGAASLVLESLEHATARQARIYAEMVGYGSSNDAFDMIASEESGRGPMHAMRMALRKSGLGPDEIDYINAHGTGTPLNDRVETTAIKGVFGEGAYRLAVSSTKSMTGHMMGAAGAFEALVSVLSIHYQAIPPTINYRTPDPACDLDYVPNTMRRSQVRAALSNSIGLGGHNSSLIFREFVP